MTDLLSRESQRNEILIDIERFIIRAEVMQDYVSLFAAIRPYVRIVYSTNPEKLREVGDVLDAIAPSMFPNRNTDPVVRSNHLDNRMDALKKLQTILNEAHVAAHDKKEFVAPPGRSGIGGAL